MNGKPVPSHRQAIRHAELDWRADDGDVEAPFSTAYDDVYFSRQDGREETRFVFIDNNDLPQRLAVWREPRPFTIGETGFGTGLNMVCAWACFDANAPAEARLHLISTEKHPLTRDALARAWRSWPQLSRQAAALLDQWPPAVAGVHRLQLDERVILDLHFGDAADCLDRLDGQVDAWFLDGFAPSKNPDMWRPELFTAMANASRPGATFATFTCAGFVRRGLSAAGFRWRKVPGFGRKREMLRGEHDPAASTAVRTPSARAATPWFQPPPPRPADHVAVIGAGIAGTSVAAALARRGSRVTLIDRGGIAAGASGNPQAALYVKMAIEPNLQSRFYLAALLYTQRWLARLDPERRWWSDCGLLQLAGKAGDVERQRRFLAHYQLPPSVVAASDPSLVTILAGVELHRHALHYPLAGWVDPVALCRHLAATPGIELRQAGLESLRETDAGWQLALGRESLHVDQVVFATGHASRHWLDGLPIQPVRGQISTLSLTPDCGSGTVPSLDRVLCAEGYVMPPRDGRLIFGATFSPNDDDDTVRSSDHRRNLEELARLVPTMAESLAGRSPEACGGRASVRAASPDKTPYAGPLPEFDRWRQDYAALGKDAKRSFDQPGSHYPGLWVSTAHGSRGMVSAPLCAELIASRIHDEPMPLERELVDHLHPGRRIVTDLIRGR
ncbi:MAG: bifunctional tRNA (5-methylaminomethyl-2-thiouridine)(34)-methyltransferase MnmD/FAD-dependent 5-carboxymethylaminomethyl-2-thiouridine(34) oxidoreductase MnmC [Salinicola sp.]|uniref:bifunctional tRNA (5-methylaminomethyl-2-thiouridine)(34)-methyltransferase MnmD/FAD-dependent 5-carboxymethylaminomethyl-2-thiouridine(34) oxidoreductase MnmC n=1 Tax=Salinicola sp. TaxID=1978524 RepID=UPI001D4F31FA|nr:bifunctional tRNA (5-methylaminomethyl-2-thiouridine)(34)-methyltransferase MnmD/FAD-dependent 5-carboxymethylaminomethyl-2-thiouridine(34) oxidoreductase MnmC [Salinicola sp.]NRB54641.1 bifunctional tRNA (5-methylaminomethyl-2-thiouridine)(34)-methyltransferase MnmD/FAD-dependent 5-carboxymethylaminomethyl-2-thiouridine(34) oxidoreductase MnmC [Salinicola sp.]